MLYRDGLISSSLADPRLRTNLLYRPQLNFAQSSRTFAGSFSPSPEFKRLFHHRRRSNLEKVMGCIRTCGVT